MKLKMTIAEALEFADEWSRGLTLHEGSQGWRVVCMLLAEEVRRQRWIPVAERLPEMDTPVWLYEPGRGAWVGERSDTGDGWLWGNTYGSHFMRKDGTWSATDNDQDADYQPTHWMPLPVLPSNALVQGPGGSSPGPAGATGCASLDNDGETT